jgi:hypothetical protein
MTNPAALARARLRPYVVSTKSMSSDAFMNANSLPAARTWVQSMSPCQWLMSMPSVGSAALAAWGATNDVATVATRPSRTDRNATAGDGRGATGHGHHR